MQTEKFIRKAKQSEWQATLFGGSLIAFASGILLVDYFSSYVFQIVLLGLFLHGLGLYRIHQRNARAAVNHS